MTRKPMKTKNNASFKLKFHHLVTSPAVDIILSILLLAVVWFGGGLIGYAIWIVWFGEVGTAIYYASVRIFVLIVLVGELVYGLRKAK